MRIGTKPIAGIEKKNRWAKVHVLMNRVLIHRVLRYRALLNRPLLVHATRGPTWLRGRKGLCQTVILAIILAGALVALMANSKAHAQPSVAVDFDRDIRPILADNCYACHGPDSKRREAQLRLDIGTSAVESKVIVPGSPDQSRLLERILESDELQRMPPASSGKRLTSQQIDLIRRWIAEGGKYSTHWAYAPLHQSPTLFTNDDRSHRSAANSIDAFLAMYWSRERITPAEIADRRVLLRRLSLDLTGLPPTPDEVDEFAANDDPAAYELLVEQRLSSPHFGERMAMYWLDLVRFADTVGYHGDQDHHASPYRDYVIDAWNRNLPFDQFTREQLAGDLLSAPTPDQITATCYNRLLQTSHEGGVQAKEYLAIYAADRVRNLSSVWLAATIGCAQCHDHKYDPYTIRDFYSLAAFFADVDEERHLRGEGGDTVPTKRFPEMPVLMRHERERLTSIEAMIADQPPPTDEARQQTMAALQSERDAIRKLERAVMITRALPAPRTVRILPRGNWLDDSGEVVSPAVPQVFGTLQKAERRNRLDLANWLTDSEQGAGAVTARVLVNRLWYLFFGSGLCRSLEDFGAQGEPPTHPELLDRLALELIDSGWDVKHLVRQILLSRAYQRSSIASPHAMETDPENRLFARQGRWRLPAESIRDACLLDCGLLVREMGGRSARPYQPVGYYRYLNFPQREYRADENASQWRRGVYVHWQRQFLHPMLKAFDAPSREECTVQRPRSNTPLAALVLLNDPSFIECARVLAQTLMTSSDSTDEHRITFAFRQVTTRSPDATELGAIRELLVASRMNFRVNQVAAGELLKTGTAPLPTAFDKVELAAWTNVCRALLNLSEAINRE